MYRSADDGPGHFDQLSDCHRLLQFLAVWRSAFSLRIYCSFDFNTITGFKVNYL
jgi:hypothetical protein